MTKSAWRIQISEAKAGYLEQLNRKFEKMTDFLVNDESVEKFIFTSYVFVILSDPMHGMKNELFTLANNRNAIEMERTLENQVLPEIFGKIKMCR